MRIVLTGGGSGGHAMPIVAVVEALNEQSFSSRPDYLWIGSKKGLERKLAASVNLPFKSILTGKLRRYFSLLNIVDVCKIPLGIIQSFFIIKKFKPDVVFSKGGYVSVPVVVAAKVLDVSIITHESDIIAGLANRIIARLADRVAVSFARSQKEFANKNVIVTGNPLRREILAGQEDRARENFGLPENKPVVLFMGGSQGAIKLNNLLSEILPSLLENYQVLHVCGRDNYDSLKAEAINSDRYCLKSFLSAEEMGDALALADLVITRAGINTLNEIAAWGKPAIIVPIDRSVLGEHQEVNARYFSEAGAAAVLPDNILTAGSLTSKIKEILSDSAKCKNYSRKMSRLAHREAAARIADQILALARTNNNDQD